MAIYSSTNDGYVLNLNSNWATAREATTGSAHSYTITRYPYSMRASASSGRGGTTYFLTRSFFEFDTSAITTVPKQATLSIRGHTFGNANVIGVKSSQSSTLATSDFDAIEGWTTGASDGSGGGDNIGNVTLYTNQLTTWSTSGYNYFTVTPKGLADMQALSTFKICIMDRDFDLRDIAPTSVSNYSGCYYADYSGTSYDPILTPREQQEAIFLGVNF